MAARPDVQARHREHSRQTHRRILDAALFLLDEKSWQEITLEELAARAGLTRTALYRHFADRRALLLALLDDMGVRLEDVPAAWERGDGDPLVELRRAVKALTTLYARQGRLLGAVADAATHDDEVRAMYLGLAERLIAAVAARIAADVAAGRSRVASDPVEVARALVWMNEGYLQAQFGRGRRGDPQRAADALSEVWIATLYGAQPSDWGA